MCIFQKYYSKLKTFSFFLFCILNHRMWVFFVHFWWIMLYILHFYWYCITNENAPIKIRLLLLGFFCTHLRNDNSTTVMNIYIYIYLVTLGCKNFLNKNFCPTLNISFFFFMFYQCKMSCVWIIKKKRGGGK